MVEMSIMTILYEAFLLISADRLACALLKINYNRYVTELIIKRMVVITWIIGIISGPIMMPLATSNEYTKTYYFIAFDILVLVLCCITYYHIAKLLWDSDRRFPQLSEDGGRIKNLKKMFLIPSLVITSYVLFNAIPDFVAMGYFTDVSHNITACLWEVSFICDPLIYIYFNTKSKQVAINILKPIQNCFSKCCQMRTFRPQQAATANNIVVAYNQVLQDLAIRSNTCESYVYQEGLNGVPEKTHFFYVVSYFNIVNIVTLRVVAKEQLLVETV